MNSDKKHSENSGKITLTGYYENLPGRQFIAPKKELIEELARECLKPACVIHSYVKGHSRPKGLTAAKIKEILAKKTGMAPEDIEL